MQRKLNLTRVICLQMGKTTEAKPYRVILRSPLPRIHYYPENPLLSKQAVISKGILVPYINLQLIPYPNTQLDLFYSDNISFWMHGFQYVTNQLMRGSQYAAYSFARIPVRD